MVRLISKLWASYWLPNNISDGQLMRLFELQPHHLTALSLKLNDRQPAAFSASKCGRVWHLRQCLPALARAANGSPRGVVSG